MRIRPIVLASLVSLSAACSSADSSAGDADETGASSDGAEAGTDTGEEVAPFEPVVCMGRAPDVGTERLCTGTEDPDGITDKVFDLECAIEADCLAPTEVEAPSEINVLTWNILRGEGLDAQLAAILDSPDVPVPDVVLLSEVDRGCTRSGNQDVVRAYAQALSMNYVYGVEFVELGPRGGIDRTCEHGNAILSRFPIGNVELVRHATNKSWFETDQPRLGGRMALVADLQVGDTTLSVASVHFESGVADEAIRGAQAAEIAQLMSARPHGRIVAGDMNAGTYYLDVDKGSNVNRVGRALKAEGFVDAHDTVPYEERPTHSEFLIIDLIFGKGVSFVDPGLCPLDRCTDMSDHAPVWVTVQL